MCQMSIQFIWVQSAGLGPLGGLLERSTAPSPKSSPAFAPEGELQKVHILLIQMPRHRLVYSPAAARPVIAQLLLSRFGECSRDQLWTRHIVRSDVCLRANDAESLQGWFSLQG